MNTPICINVNNNLVFTQDKRKSQCYLDNGEDPRGRRPFGRRDCARPVGDIMTRSTCCCSVGNSWYYIFS